MTDLPMKFDADGLIPVVIQDDSTGDVLMLAYMNNDALEQTRETGRTHFWSRSRQALWRKGETSGHEQIVKSIHVNCYENSLLVRVDQIGACCHTGFPTCFYRELTADNELVETESRRFDPESVYGDRALVDLETWLGAYRWLADHDLAGVSGTSRHLRESNVPVLSARVADELRELAGVVSGDHVHKDQTTDALLEGSQVMYWLVLTAIRAGLGDAEIIDSIRSGTTTEEQVAPADMPPTLRAIAEEWQRAFFRGLDSLITRSVARVGMAAAATDTSLSAMIARDLAELRSRSYLADFFAQDDS
jgi:phosphoribosyl-AMP cyclohydrolase